jgi:hypothetical protein
MIRRGTKPPKPLSRRAAFGALVAAFWSAHCSGTGANGSGGAGASGHHPSDAMACSGHWYRFTQANISGSDAQTACQSLGGYLACITSQAENACVLALAGSARPWIGLNDEATVGDYVWINGSPVTYMNWQPGQPDNPSTERWVKLNADGTWDDASMPSSYVCQWDQ